MDLVVMIYDLTRDFPSQEKFGLTSQLRRAAISVPSNISEGAADRTMGQFVNFLGMAIGSLNELNTQIEIAFRIGYLNRNAFIEAESAIDECLAVTFGLKKSVARRK